MNREVLSKYDIMIVGEILFVIFEIVKLYVEYDRNEFNMFFYFEYMDMDCEGSKWNVKFWKLIDLKKIMYKWYLVLKDKGWNLFYFNNYD